MSKIDNLIKQLCPNGVECKKIGDICEISRGIVISKNYIQDNIGEYPVYSSQTEDNGCLGKIKTFAFEGEYLTWTTDGANAGTLFYRTGRFNITNVCGLLKVKDNAIYIKYLYYSLGIEAPKYVNNGMGNAKLMSNVMSNIRIPLPPLPIQEEIVRILDKMVEQQQTIEKLIELRKKQYEYYREELLKPKEGWVTKTLGEIGTNLDSKRKPITGSKREKGDFPYYGASGIVDYVKNYIFDGTYLLISEDGANLLARSTPIAFIITGKNWVNNHAHVIEIKDYNERKFVEIFLNSISLEYYISDGAQPKLNQENLNKIEVSFPSKQDLEKIVPILDKLESSISELTQTLEVCKKRYTHYRDELLRF